jgi:predicted small secreted protein
MKKLILFTVLIIAGVMLFSSCGATKRGTGCPMTDNIIH